MTAEVGKDSVSLEVKNQQNLWVARNTEMVRGKREGGKRPLQPPGPRLEEERRGKEAFCMWGGCL